MPQSCIVSQKLQPSDEIFVQRIEELARKTQKTCSTAMSTEATMGLSFNILFLGWWLTGQWWTCRGQYYVKPFITVTPSEVVAVGGNVSIHCRSEGHKEVTFTLVKEERASLERVDSKDSEKDGVIFHIINARPRNGGSYKCIYCLRSEHCQRWSPYSNRVHINITDPSLTRPAISMNSSGSVFLGKQIKIRCKVQGRPASGSFYLHKPEDPTTKWPMESNWDVGEFSISNLNWGHNGNYTCIYALRERPFVFSAPSDPLELLVSDPKLTRPTISKSPTGSVALGGQVKIHCEIQGGPAKFYLHKDGDPAAKWPMENDRNVGEFFISNVNWEHQGNYTCSYALTTRPSGFLVHSDPLELLVSDTDRSRDIITWVGCAVGLLVLVLLLLFLLFILNRKRRKSSTASERTQHLPMKETDMTQEVEDDTEGIAYATLNHYSSKTKQTANPDTLPESCVYAAVANNSTRKDQ